MKVQSTGVMRHNCASMCVCVCVCMHVCVCMCVCVVMGHKLGNYDVRGCQVVSQSIFL